MRESVSVKYQTVVHLNNWLLIECLFSGLRASWFAVTHCATLGNGSDLYWGSWWTGWWAVGWWYHRPLWTNGWWGAGQNVCPLAGRRKDTSCFCSKRYNTLTTAHETFPWKLSRGRNDLRQVSFCEIIRESNIVHFGFCVEMRGPIEEMTRRNQTSEREQVPFVTVSRHEKVNSAIFGSQSG